MTDEKILAVYQQVRSRYNFFDYWEKVLRLIKHLMQVTRL
jgi:hypothetical protein